MKGEKNVIEIGRLYKLYYLYNAGLGDGNIFCFYLFTFF